MRYQIKQRLLTLSPSFDIADEQGTPILRAQRRLMTLLADYTISSLDRKHEFVRIRAKWAWLPKFEISRKGELLATVSRRFSFRPRYTVEAVGKDDLWIGGSLRQHEYQLKRKHEGGDLVAIVSRAMWTISGRYSLDVVDPDYEAIALATVIIIDDAWRKQSQAATS